MYAQYLSTSKKGKSLVSVFVNLHSIDDFSPVIDKLPMDESFSEDQSRDYFIDLMLGLEFCK